MIFNSQKSFSPLIDTDNSLTNPPEEQIKQLWSLDHSVEKEAVIVPHSVTQLLLWPGVHVSRYPVTSIDIHLYIKNTLS